MFESPAAEYLPVADVVGVEVTIDGLLLIADRLHVVEFPTVLGVRQNIPQEELRTRVWDRVARDLTTQGVLDGSGQPHSAVALMIDTIGRAERTLECRWWRKALDGSMVRFAVCRRGHRQVLAVRNADLVVIQLMAPQASVASMVTAVLGSADAAAVEPLTRTASELFSCTTAEHLTAIGVPPSSARGYADIIAAPTGWVEITAAQRHSGGTTSVADAAAGVLDSDRGRLVSLPRIVGGELYGSFLSGTEQNLQRALDALLEFLPAGRWLDDREID